VSREVVRRDFAGVGRNWGEKAHKERDNGFSHLHYILLARIRRDSNLCDALATNHQRSWMQGPTKKVDLSRGAHVIALSLLRLVWSRLAYCTPRFAAPQVLLRLAGLLRYIHHC
jgi:hypothetical protein